MTAFSYREIASLDVKNLFELVRIIVVNFILAFIFLFLILEEIEWSAFSFIKKIDFVILDNTSWNLKIF